MAESMLLTAREAAAALQVSERTLWTLANTLGKIPFVKLGRLVRFDPADLRAFIESAKVRKGNVTYGESLN